MGLFLPSWAEQPVNLTETFALPADPFFFQPGKGQAIANTYCLICHSADYIYMQPKHSKTKWQAIITKMQQVFGCPIPDDQIGSLATYLFEQNTVAISSSSYSR